VEWRVLSAIFLCNHNGAGARSGIAASGLGQVLGLRDVQLYDVFFIGDFLRYMDHASI
jgi:hypothetical protein